MAGNLRLRDTWSLLRVLLDPTHTKASQRKNISLLLYSSSLTDTEFLATLQDGYLCTDPHTPLPAYSGSSNSDLDADISLGEKSAAVEAALSSPRQDLQLRLVTRAEDGGARHCLGGKTGSLKAAHIAAF
ncbi:hypothetical protein MRX96_055099 [Rhipicephalus microplus]